MGASNRSDAEVALDAVLRSIDELDELTKAGIQRGDPTQLRARADRWKRATVELLQEHFGREDVIPFARKPIAPTWVGMEDPFALLSSHRAYLVELARELRDHPERYRRRQAAAAKPTLSPAPASRPAGVAQGDAERAHSPPGGLPYPERVTLAWLFKHAPVSLVVAGVALLVAAFALGFRLGQNPFAVHSLSWIPGLSR